MSQRKDNPEAKRVELNEAQSEFYSLWDPWWWDCDFDPSSYHAEDFMVSGCGDNFASTLCTPSWREEILFLLACGLHSPNCPLQKVGRHVVRLIAAYVPYGVVLLMGGSRAQNNSLSGECWEASLLRYGKWVWRKRAPMPQALRCVCLCVPTM